MAAKDFVELRVDREREARAAAGKLPKTNVYVAARRWDGEFVKADIIELDKASLLHWLRSRGGENVFAENLVLLLLGHERE
jgi:hypothetical protein